MKRPLLFKRGFTMIELLVVIAIVGVLSAIGIETFIGIQQRGRDGRRKGDLQQIRSALEFYRADNSNYPDNIPNCPSPGIATFLGNPACTQTYLQTIPVDPVSSTYNNGNYFYSKGSSATYTLGACLEYADMGIGTTGTSPGGGGTCPSGRYYVLTNP